MLPPEQGKKGQQRVVHRVAVSVHGLHGLHGPLYIYRVPPHDGGREQVQPAGPVALLLEAPAPDFAQPVKEPGPD